MADAIQVSPERIREIGAEMGLPKAPNISEDQFRRSKITIIRANWHLLPYAQLLKLLDMSPAELAFMLREDDFLYVKLGNLKPKCSRIAGENSVTQDQLERFRSSIPKESKDSSGRKKDELFGFLTTFEQPVLPPVKRAETAISPRFCYSYFALYGDPLLNPSLDPYPDHYLKHLAASGVDAVWLQGVLKNLAPYPFDSSEDSAYPIRIENLKKLVARLKKHGIGLYLYLNEPRSLPIGQFKDKSIQGVVEGDYAALCTSAPEVRNYLRDSIKFICAAVPDLKGFFTITASENLTNCWSHGNGKGCPLCGKRSQADIISELHKTFHEGLTAAGSKAELIAWDWGWSDASVQPVLESLPKSVCFMTVSEWGMPIDRGGVKSTVGEYSISTVGPGERARKNWAIARQLGLKTLAKIQAGNTWELSSIPYIPAVANVARHALNLREAGISGVMLGWTLGGFPSPNLDVVTTILSNPGLSDSEAMTQVAERRFGKSAVPFVVNAWKKCSEAFSEFPFSGTVVYNAPLQMGPANLLWPKKTGYPASMVGFPYDDLQSWRGHYPEDIFIQQISKVADGWSRALEDLKVAVENIAPQLDHQNKAELDKELTVAEAAGIHFQSVANQCRFVQRRDRLKQGDTNSIQKLEELIKDESALALRLFHLQSRDSRIGFEASNQYFYTPNDLLEKVLNCQYLLREWIPSLRA
ncbi:MAG: hypothetical protein ACTHMT_02595 [Verrucomicrobiota bacterium]